MTSAPNRQASAPLSVPPVLRRIHDPEAFQGGGERLVAAASADDRGSLEGGAASALERSAPAHGRARLRIRPYSGSSTGTMMPASCACCDSIHAALVRMRERQEHLGG